MLVRCLGSVSFRNAKKGRRILEVCVVATKSAPARSSAVCVLVEGNGRREGDPALNGSWRAEPIHREVAAAS